MPCVEIRFGAGTFAVTVGDGHLDIQRGAADHPGAVIVTDPVTLEEVAFGMRTLDGAESAGDLLVDGDHAVAERFLSMFPVGQDQSPADEVTSSGTTLRSPSAGSAPHAR